MRQRHPWLLPAFAAASFATLVVPTGIILWRHAFEPLPAHGLRTLRLVYHQVMEEHFAEHDPDEMLERAIAGMVAGLDPYSKFVAARDVTEFEGSELEGTYVGIGVQLFGERLPLRVKTPLLDSPALAAGLLPGDALLAIDDWEVPDGTPADSLRAATDRLRGKAGTTARLLIQRAEQAPFVVSITRDNVPEPKVKWVHLVDVERKLGYVYVEGFQRHMSTAFDRAIVDLEQAAGGALRGLVLDLRHDPGGLLEEAIALSNRFIASGELVSLKRRGEVVVERHVADAGLCTLPDLPVVVLIDGSTASASEVVTGALQDHGRARVVGVRSYGKGVVQSIFTWRDEDFRLRLTTSHYYTPNGRSIEGKLRRAEDGEAVGGLEPDVVVALERDQQRLIANRLLGNEVPARFVEAARAAATRIDAVVLGPLEPGEDPQLAAAVTELRRLTGDDR